VLFNKWRYEHDGRYVGREDVFRTLLREWC